ncbi:MAG: 2-hydroxyacyl-CoA dehydratase, partial [Planctomycetota bacterium]
MSPSFLDKVRGQPLEEVLFQCREFYEDTNFPTVKAWREEGGKVLGHFQVYFPEEIAHAAGMLPLNLHGANLQPDQADSRFGSYLCSTIKTTLELALSEHVVLDAFVTHPICDAARNLGAIFGRNFDYPCEILYLPQNPNSSASVDYLRGEYDRLKRMIEGVAGVEITEQALRDSMTVFNRNRALLRELYVIKREAPEKIAAEDAYALMAMGGR